MADNPEKDKQQDSGTGPQGTRVFRRENIEQHFAERQAESDPQPGTQSGAAFIGIHGAFRGKRFDIPDGRSTLGRDSQNDIVVNADSVSLVHARLIEKDGQYRVLNLLSTNGTWVNDKKVSDAVLQDGDLICFGEAEFLFQKSRQSRSEGGFGKKFRRWFGG